MSLTLRLLIVLYIIMILAVMMPLSDFLGMVLGARMNGGS